MTADRIVICGARVVTPQGVVERDIVVEGEKIAALVAPGTQVEAERIDASGRVIFPGAIDGHIHLGHGNDISRPRVPADADTETAAAARGGVTTFISYVMSAEPYETFFEDMVQVAQERARVDFGFHFVIATPDQLAAVPTYINRLGVPTAKLFMNIRGNEGDRLGLPPIDDGFTYSLLESLAANGGMLCPHPENIEIAWMLGARLRQSGAPADLAAWNAARPPFIEAEAIRRISYLASVAGSRVYCVHTSSAAALDQARKARAEGIDIHIETCNHYLTHDISDPIGMIGKINPPLRERPDCEALWQGIRDGTIDTLASDHIHRPVSSKDGDIWKASPGCPGLDTFLQVPISEGYHKRGIPLERIAQLTAENPARLMGLRSKGRIEAGMDADLAIVDLDDERVIGKSDVSSDARYSIYEGRSLKGTVTDTMVRGRWAWRDGAHPESTAGHGRFQFRKL